MGNGKLTTATTGVSLRLEGQAREKRMQRVADAVQDASSTNDDVSAGWTSGENQWNVYIEGPRHDVEKAVRVFQRKYRTTFTIEGTRYKLRPKRKKKK